MAHLILFRVTGLIPGIPDFRIRYRFAMSALFPSQNLAQKLSYAWCRRHCSSIREPGAHGGTVFKESAAVCASLSIKVLDYSIFSLIMHKIPGFCGKNKKPGFYSIFRLIMHSSEFSFSLTLSLSLYLYSLFLSLSVFLFCVCVCVSLSLAICVYIYIICLSLSLSLSLSRSPNSTLYFHDLYRYLWCHATGCSKGVSCSFCHICDENDFKRCAHVCQNIT